MHITRQTPTELVVEDSSLWISYLCAGAGFLLLVLSIAQKTPKGFLVAAFFLLSAAIFERKTTFTFDAMQRIVHWRGLKLFKRDSGEIRFDDITDIGIDVSSADASVVTYRLTILSAQGSIPMAYTYAGRTDGYAPLRQQILDFVKPGAYVPSPEPGVLSSGIPAELESSIRSLLAQGRKIDAVTLLRSRQHIGLADAVARIDAIENPEKADA